MNKLFKKLVVLCCSAFSLTGMPAHAGTTTGTIASSVTLGSDCSITVNAMSFGVSSALMPANVNATSPLTIQCTAGTAYTIAIGQSTSGGTAIPGASGKNHLMTGTGITVGGHQLYLPYNLNQDAAGAQPWGYTTGTDTVGGTGTGQPSTITVYGQLVSGTSGVASGHAFPIQPGNYIDTVTITLSY